MSHILQTAVDKKFVLPSYPFRVFSDALWTEQTELNSEASCIFSKEEEKTNL
jgi:hypothetical protein